MNSGDRIAIIGLGYVGLPLAVEFGKHYPTVGFDIDPQRVAALQRGEDVTREIGADELTGLVQLQFTARPEDIADANVYIVAVPTPIDKNKQPDLRALKGAVEQVAKLLKKGDLVIFESTVYPGCTEEFCVPLLEQGSGFIFNRDFYCGYSPERINPGDREHRLGMVCKVTAGSTPQIADRVSALYRPLIPAGIHQVGSIKVAEAAKVIENCQRDINIAFVNELAMLFERLGLDTQEVLKAAGTKWNFMPYEPGLVGGHCIGVDPYYLTYKAQEVNYDPQVILSGRRINDLMPVYLAKRIVKLLLEHKHTLKDVRCLLLGITYKQHTPDIRNSKSVEVYRELVDFGLQVEVHDPWADPMEVRSEFGIDLVDEPQGPYQLILLNVAHREFKEIDLDVLSAPNAVVFDVKSFLEKDKTTARL